VRSTSLTPEQRSLRARIGAYALHAAGATNTGPATRAFMERFEREVDPEGSLTPDERRRRAGHARMAHMTALALRSSRVRSNRKAPAVSETSTEAKPEVLRASDERPAV
jgi:hypothetical protein